MERVIKFRAISSVTGKIHYQDKDLWEFLRDCYGMKLEQFTGLHDKNGKEIYEGDVVRMDSFEPSDYIVKFIDGAFCLWNDDVGYGTDIHYTHHAGRKQATVTSNIHERG